MGVIVIALIGVLVLGFLTKDILVYAVSPEKYVLLAINKTYKSVSKDLDKMSSILVGDMEPNGSYTNHIGLSIDNIGGFGGLYSFNGMEIDLTTSMDRNKKVLHLNGESVLGGRDLISLNARLDDNELLLHIPDIYYDAFSIPSKDLGRQWNNSYLGMQSYTRADESLDISFSNLIGDSTAILMDDTTKAAYLRVFKSLTKNAIYEKNGKQELYIGGSGRKSNKTTVILNENDIKNGVLELIDVIRNDNRVVYWKDTLRSANQDYLVQEFDESLNEISSEIEEYFQVDRVLIDVYTDKGGLVKADLIITPDFDYRDESLLIGLEFFGDKNPIDNFNFRLILGENEEAKIELSSKGNHTGSKNQFTDETRLAIYDGYQYIDLGTTVEIDLSKTRDNFKYNLALEADGTNLKLDTRGDFTSSAKNVDYNLHDISLKVDDYYGDGFNIQGGLRLGWEKGAKDISNLGNVEKLQILEMGEYELYEIANTIDLGLYWLMDQIDGY